MKYNKSSLVIAMVGLLSSKVCAMTYADFYEELRENSSQIKVKKYELEAEIEKRNQADLYFLPKIRADVSKKRNMSGEEEEAKFSASSTLYTTETSIRKDIANDQVVLSRLGLMQEEERLYRLMLENVISIKIYGELLKDAEYLKRQSIDLYEQIERNYQLGLAKPSDRNQGKLLIERIQTDIESISREIALFKANIELATGVEYPEIDVTIDEEKLTYIETFEAKIENIKNNIEYQIVNMQSDIARKDIQQQNPLFELKLFSEYKLKDGEESDDSHIGIQGGWNIFNYESRSNVKAKSSLYLAALEKADNKFKEMSAKLKTTIYTRNSNIEEMKSLNDQLKTTEKILNNQQSEYEISQSSYYEMLNTRYDLFTTKKRISDKRINVFLNSIEMLQLNGALINNEYQS